MGVKFGIETVSTDDLLEVSRVEVQERLGETISYTVVFSEDVCEGDFKLLNHPSFSPFKEMSIWVEVDNKKNYLVKGPVKAQQIKLVNGGQGSELQVKGTDNTIKMKQAETKFEHKNVSDSDIVLKITDKYGFRVLMMGSVGFFMDEKKHGKVQNQDDLSFLKQIGKDLGRFLWMTYEEDGSELLIFNELPLDESPSARLVLNESETELNNIDELTINWDADVPDETVGEKKDAKSGKAKNVAVTEASQPKLGDVTLKTLKKNVGYNQQVKPAHRPVDEEGPGQQRSKAALNESEFFIKASCTTSFDKICKVIHAHSTVEILGAGSRHNGKYFVSAVTHTLDASSYKMQLELMRNAWSEKKEINGKQGNGQ